MSKSIIVALDEHKQTKFEQVLDQLNPNLCMVKIGSVSFNSLGREAVIKAASKGFDIFLDLKLHDIPNTVHDTILGFNDCEIEMLTVHLSGGEKMLNKAMDAGKNINAKVIGVSVLTSLKELDSLTLFGNSIVDDVVSCLYTKELLRSFMTKDALGTAAPMLFLYNFGPKIRKEFPKGWLLYTSDAADE